MLQLVSKGLVPDWVIATNPILHVTIDCLCIRWQSVDIWKLLGNWRSTMVRAQNNGRSLDNVQPRWLFVWTKFGFGGHFDQSRTLFPNDYLEIIYFEFRPTQWISGTKPTTRSLSIFWPVRKRHDWAKIGLAGQHDRPLFKNYFEPCKVDMLATLLQCTWNL